MKKIAILVCIFSILFIGCSSKEPISTVEATDYAMGCEALISEIKDVRSQLQAEKEANLASNVVGGVLTLGIWDADEEKEIMLRERAKSLQLIYTIKQAKGECKALTKKDIEVESQINRQAMQVKKTIDSTKEVLE